MVDAQAQSSAESVAARKAARVFPSVFQAWNPSDNLPGEPPMITLARHDLAWIGPDRLGLRWNDDFPGLATGFVPETIATGRQRRHDLLALNPCMILLIEIRYRDAHRQFLPEGHPWWKRGPDGLPAPGWEEGGYLLLDFANPEYRRHVAAQAAAAVASGAFDGILLDWWQDDADRLALVQEIRQAVGPDALILANTNDRTCPRTAEFINGYFMECSVSDRPEKWRQIETTLAWAEANLRQPRLNCLETWYQTSRDDLHLMRAVTCLALTRSDGYCLFSDPNDLPTPDHLHNWYPFWNKRLGKPLPAGARAEQPLLFAAWNQKTPLPPQTCPVSVRHFDRGTAVYNPMGHESIVVRFPCPRTSVATGRRGFDHYLANCDGDIYLH